MPLDIEIKHSPEFLRELSVDELNELLLFRRQQLLELRTQAAQRFGHYEKPHLVKKVKKDIARIITIVSQK